MPTVQLVSAAEIQRAAFARLVAVVTAEAAVDGAPTWLDGLAARVFAHLPMGTPMPCIRLRFNPSADWGTKLTNGWDGELVVDSWTDQHSHMQALEMGDLIMRAFHQQAAELVIQSGKVVVLHYASGDANDEPDHTHHLTQHFRMLASSPGT